MFHSLQSRETGNGSRTKLFDIAKGGKDFVQRLKLDYKIVAHTGCVNTLCWSSSGQNILSGSDDQHLVITDPFQKKKLTSIRSGHRANIFSAKYLPFSGDRQVISCSGDGKIYYTKVGNDDQHEASLFDCHFGTTYEVIVVPNEASTFLSCGEDGTVRWFDLRIKNSCLKEDCKDDVLINCRRAVTSLAVNPVVPYQLAIGCSDSSVRLFDRRMLGTRSSGHYTGRGLTGMVSSFTAPNLASRSHRITSLSYSPDGNDMLVSYSSEYIYLFDTNETKPKQLEKVFTKPEKAVAPSGVEKKAFPGFRSFPSISSAMTKPSTSTVPPQPAVSSSKIPAPLSTHRLATSLTQSSAVSSSQPSATLSSQTLAAKPSQSTTVTPGPIESVTAPSPDDEGYAQEQMTDPFSDDQPEMSRQPPFKRLRMRGDWSDTGPNARPEAERNAQGRNRPLMQRMSDMLTRWLDGNLRNSGGGEQNQSNQEQASGSQDASTEEGSTEMEEVPSGWQDMPSASGSEISNMEVDNNDLEQPTSSNITSGSEQHDTTGESNNTHVCDNSNPIDYSSSHSNSNNDDSKDPSSQGDSVHSNSPQSERTQNVNNENPQNVSSETSEDLNRESGQLEPVISLHYSTEGTTSSTIRLGFARFENLEAGILQRSAEDASLSDLVPENVGNLDQNNVLESHDSHGISDLQDSLGYVDSNSTQSHGVTIEKDSFINPSEAQSNDSELLEELATTSDNLIDTQASTNEHISSSEGQRSSDASSSSDGGQTSLNTLQYELSDVNTNPPVMENSEGQSSTSSQLLAESKDQSSSQDKPSSTSEAQSSSSDHSLVDESQRSSNSPASHMSHLQIRPDTSTIEDDISVPPALPRLRRIGRSGPSLGDISVGLEVENSDEGEVEETGENREGGRDTLERHITAIRLQEMYRKRQEEKEKEEMEMRNIFQPSVKVKYRGHRNARTMIKEANFWGENYVMSGSDCGHIFIWDRLTARLVMLLEGDRHVVNCLQPHPFDPVLASSGIDYDIKIWAPLDECSTFNEEVANEIMSRNEIMLEETRDTVTVPAAFMLRVLASLNQIRAGRASVSNRNQEQASSDSD